MTSISQSPLLHPETCLSSVVTPKKESHNQLAVSFSSTDSCRRVMDGSFRLPSSSRGQRGRRDMTLVSTHDEHSR